MGYLHTGIEKSCEDKSYWKVITFVERMDYLSYFFQMEAFCGCVERLVELEIPPRAQYLRVLHMELDRIMSHLVWLGTTALASARSRCSGTVASATDLDLFEMATGQRMHALSVGGVIRTSPSTEAKPRSPRRRPVASARCSTATRSSSRAPRGPASCHASGCWSWA